MHGFNCTHENFRATTQTHVSPFAKHVSNKYRKVKLTHTNKYIC